MGIQMNRTGVIQGYVIVEESFDFCENTENQLKLNGIDNSLHQERIKGIYQFSFKKNCQKNTIIYITQL